MNSNLSKKCFRVYGYDNLHNSPKVLSTAKHIFYNIHWIQNYPANQKIILSTCNRQEVYFLSPPCFSVKPIHGAFFYQGPLAMEKLFLTAAGLNTPVFGDKQIYQQVKKAYREAKSQTPLHPFLNQIFLHCFETVHNIYEKTNIQEYQSSFSELLFEKIKPHFSGFESIALLGTGELAKELLSFFKKERLSFVEIYGRTNQKIKELSQSYGYKGKNLSKFKPEDHNVIICALQLETALLNQESFQKVSKPLILFDLGQPPNVGVLQHPLIERYNLSSFQTQRKKQQRTRAQIKGKAQKIIRNTIEKIIQKEQGQWQTQELNSKPFKDSSLFPVLP